MGKSGSAWFVAYTLECFTYRKHVQRIQGPVSELDQGFPSTVIFELFLLSRDSHL